MQNAGFSVFLAFSSVKKKTSVGAGMEASYQGKFFQIEQSCILSAWYLEDSVLFFLFYSDTTNYCCNDCKIAGPLRKEKLASQQENDS